MNIFKRNSQNIRENKDKSAKKKFSAELSVLFILIICFTLLLLSLQTLSDASCGPTSLSLRAWTWGIEYELEKGGCGQFTQL